MTESLVVAEMFGPTLQGEGPHAGQRAAFLRLGGCNLSCGWCDTAYTWDARHYRLREQMRRLELPAVEAELLRLGTRLVVVTGGEPLLQQHHRYGLAALVKRLRLAGVATDVETNGTLSPVPELADSVQLFVVSPKLANAGMTTGRRLRPRPLRHFAELARAGRAAFKFVCISTGDLAEVDGVVRAHRLPRSAVWIMPEGTTAQTLCERARHLSEAAVAAGFNYTTRLQVLAWGAERGR